MSPFSLLTRRETSFLYRDDVNRILSGAQLALDDGVGTATPSLEVRGLRLVDILPVFWHVPAAVAFELEVPTKLVIFWLQPSYIFQLSLELESDLNHVWKDFITLYYRHKGWHVARVECNYHNLKIPAVS